MIQTPKINLIHGDCMELMRDTPDGWYDLAIPDPPYGIGIDGFNTTNKAPKPKALSLKKRDGIQRLLM